MPASFACDLGCGAMEVQFDYALRPRGRSDRLRRRILPRGTQRSRLEVWEQARKGGAVGLQVVLAVAQVDAVLGQPVLGLDAGGQAEELGEEAEADAAGAVAFDEQGFAGGAVDGVAPDFAEGLFLFSRDVDGDGHGDWRTATGDRIGRCSLA